MKRLALAFGLILALVLLVALAVGLLLPRSAGAHPHRGHRVIILTPTPLVIEPRLVPPHFRTFIVIQPRPIWVPGFWSWNGLDWVWVSGHWAFPPRGLLRNPCD